MAPRQTHTAVSQDGIRIVGTVHGEGPPVVLVHGAVADGESEWGPLLPYLTDHFTCYLPSTRGRGLSDPHPDRSREARVQDITAFVDSIGEQVGLIGTSGGAMIALGVPARTSAVSTLVAREPVVFEVMDDDTRARFEEVVDELAAGIDRGDPLAGALPFLGWAANAEEVAALSASDEGMDEFLAYLPIDLEEFREALAFRGPSPTEPATLARISAPTLVLHGARTSQAWFTTSALTVADLVPGATAREIEGVGHFGHLVEPEREARILVPYLEASLQPA
jgi:pimeloyl-ACP methyl ester carboxylesterase